MALPFTFDFAQRMDRQLRQRRESMKAKAKVRKQEVMAREASAGGTTAAAPRQSEHTSDLAKELEYKFEHYMQPVPDIHLPSSVPQAYDHRIVEAVSGIRDLETLRKEPRSVVRDKYDYMHDKEAV
jgi:hypothetical protein